MFTLTKEIRKETRTFKDASGKESEREVYVCYIRLTKKDFDTIVNERLSGMDEKLEAYGRYCYSGNGQQVMHPVMQLDWTNKVTSKFGSRLHPIRKERAMHNGIDIGVPTGTQLYSAVTGTVTRAAYSDSAGYYVTVTDYNGYKVTFMHMSSYAVAEGQQIRAGEFVGLSGNTGASTGPHLHLAIQDENGNYLNPIFIVPSNGAF